METPKKSDKKKGLKNSKMTGVKKPNAKPADQKTSFNEDEDEFDLPLDELDTFDNFSEYDDEEDY
ncbi:MAG TPA: hypothetical protein DIT07_15060 [Sphingobacteriaceae bacterium]|nr:hypothetical protein [Sphingobacteriaceae bacterium]